MDFVPLLFSSGGPPANKVITMDVKYFWNNLCIEQVYIADKLAQYNVIDRISIWESGMIYDKQNRDGKSDQMTYPKLKMELAQPRSWYIIWLVMASPCGRGKRTCGELALASHATATGNECDTEKAEICLEMA